MSEGSGCKEAKPYVIMAACEFPSPRLNELAMDFTNSFWLLNSEALTNDDVSTRNTMTARRVLIVPVLLSKEIREIALVLAPM